MPEDLSPFFDGLDRAELRIVTPQGSRRVTGYFDNSYVSAELGEVTLDTTQPRFTCKAADICWLPHPSVFRGWNAYVGKTRYSLVQVQPEGTGLATVILAHEEN